MFLMKTSNQLLSELSWKQMKSFSLLSEKEEEGRVMPSEGKTNWKLETKTKKSNKVKQNSNMNLLWNIKSEKWWADRCQEKKDRKGEHHCSQKLQSAHWLVTINSWLSTFRCTLFQTGGCMWVHQTRWAARNRDNSSTLITVVWGLTGMCDLAGVWGQTGVCSQADEVSDMQRHPTWLAA